MPEPVPLNYTRLSLRPDEGTHTTLGDDSAESLGRLFGSHGVDSCGLFSSPPRQGTGRSMVTAAVQQALARTPLTDPLWCLHTGRGVEVMTGVAGINWAAGVSYTPMVSGYVSAPRGRTRHVHRPAAPDIGPDGPVPRYPCGHCALVVAAAYLAANPITGASGYGAIVAGCVASLEPTDLENLLPEGPETIGGTVMNTTNTIGLDGVLPNSCGTCGLMGHNARTCSRTNRAYSKVGIEIEGLWNDLRAVRNRADEAGLTGCTDGSVNTNLDSTASPYEFQTHPGSLREAVSQLVSFYPDETNASCGMHVHVSFNVSTDATLLASQEFYDYFRARWIAWGRREHVWGEGTEAAAARGLFWARLYGQNDFCRINRSSERHFLTMDRYHQLNFSAWNEHRTIECRLLPMFKSASLGVSAVQELLSIFEDYLHSHTGFPEVSVAMVPPASAPILIEGNVGDPDTWVSDARFEVEAQDYVPQLRGTSRIWAGLADRMSVREMMERVLA